MLPLLIGTAFAIGIAVLIYVHHDKQPPSSGHANCTNTKSRPSNSIKKFKVLICAICQERISSMISTDLKCGHSFHTDCLADLIKNHHKKCPYCEHDIEICNN